MSRYRHLFIYAVISLVVAGGLWFVYQSGRIGSGSLVFLVILALTVGTVAAIFMRRLSQPAESVEQLLYDTDHRPAT